MPDSMRIVLPELPASSGPGGATSPRIPRPVTVKVRDEYVGCHSWLDLHRELPFEGTPVLSDDEFARVEAEIEEIATEAIPVIPGRRDLVYA